jgi:hypothetical protein
MTPAHALTLYVLLSLLGVSLIIPGVMGVFRLSEGSRWLFAETVDAKNHLRALNGMMTALGIVALWACWNINEARELVIALGLVMVTLVVARLYSMVVDGLPGGLTMLYFIVEVLMATIFLIWPPPIVLSQMPVG